MLVLYNEDILPKEEVRISPDDRGYVFGDGVYEVFRIYRGRLFEEEAHLRRLRRSAAETRIDYPFPEEELVRKLERLTEVNGISEGTLYIQFTRGIAPRKHAFPQTADTVVYACCQEAVRPIAAMQDGIEIIVRPDIRWLRCDIKTLNLLPNVLYKQEALDHGAADVAMHRGGRVTECSASNIMMVKDGIVYTHPANELILHGVTRGLVLRLAAEAGIPVMERACTLETFMEADEVFITGTTVEITPVIAIDGRPVANAKPGAVTRQLQNAFERRIPQD